MLDKTTQDWRALAADLDIEGRAFIDGQFKDSLSGETRATMAPANGRKLAEVANCGTADADLAVGIARAVFASGVWAAMAPADRKMVLVRWAELIEDHADEIALLESLDVGKPIADTTAVDNGMRIAQEEIFGPVMSVIGFNDAEEAVAIANDSMYGLAGAVWSNNINTAHKVAAAVRVGTMGINNYFGGDVTVPFGGFKQSGNGRDKSMHAFEDYTELKTTWIEFE